MSESSLSPYSRLTGTAFVILICSALGLPRAQAQITAQPAPPPQICVNAVCATSATTSASSSASGPLKFHPGFYPYFDYSGGVTLARLGNGNDGLDLQLIRSLGPSDNVTGIGVGIMWRAIDTGTTGPQYDWSVLDAYFKACKAQGKRFWVRVQDAIYGKVNVANGGKVVPDWLINQYGAQNVMANLYSDSTPSGLVAKRYNPAVTNAYIAMLQAIAARYDSDPMFEGVTVFQETSYDIDTSGSSVTLATPGADYSAGQMMAELDDLMAAMRDPKLGFKTSNVEVPANYLFKSSDSASNWTSVLTKIQQYRMVLGGPDSWMAAWTYPDSPYNAPQSSPKLGGPAATNPSYYRSLTSDEVYRGWGPGLSSWVGKILFGPEVDLMDMGGYITANLNPLPTLADVWRVRGPQLDNSQYFFFDINYGPSGNYGGSPQHWATGEYPWVKAAGSTNTMYPYD